MCGELAGQIEIAAGKRHKISVYALLSERARVVGVKWASLCLKSFVLCVLLCAVSALVSKFVKQTEMSRNEMQFLLLLLYFFLPPLLPPFLVCLISGASISFCTIKAMVLRIPA